MNAGGQNPNAWYNWYHAIGTTYGTWLRGDPRGFRTFRHRSHVEGDYHKPPAPGSIKFIFEQSRKSLRYPPVFLDRRQREVVCVAMSDRLWLEGVELRAATVMANHFHLLARFPRLPQHVRESRRSRILRDGRDPAPRQFVGLAKKHASFELRERGLKPAGTVWAARPKCVPIHDEGHFQNAAAYIVKHAVRGGAVFDAAREFLFQIDRGFAHKARRTHSPGFTHDQRFWQVGPLIAKSTRLSFGVWHPRFGNNSRPVDPED